MCWCFPVNIMEIIPIIEVVTVITESSTEGVLKNLAKIHRKTIFGSHFVEWKSNVGKSERKVSHGRNRLHVYFLRSFLTLILNSSMFFS